MGTLSVTGFLIVAVAALLASTIAAVAGTGGGIILLPVLVATLGVRDAVPVYTLAQFIGNLSRVGFNWREVRRRVVVWFALGAVPMAIAGAILFARTGDQALMRILGAFLLASVAWRRMRGNRRGGFPVQRFTLIGGVFAFVSALVGSAGPFLAPFFLAFGLTRGAYIGTEALATAIMHLTKMGTYGASGVFAAHAVFIGLALGPIMVLGSWLGKQIVDRISERLFIVVVDIALVFFGSVFLIRG